MKRWHVLVLCHGLSVLARPQVDPISNLSTTLPDVTPSSTLVTSSSTQGLTSSSILGVSSISIPIVPSISIPDVTSSSTLGVTSSSTLGVTSSSTPVFTPSSVPVVTPSSATPSPTPIVLSTAGTNGVYQGCFVDIVDGTPLLNGAAFLGQTDLTQQRCEDLCTGFQYFGIDNGVDCRCGNDFAHGATSTPGDCTTPAAGSANNGLVAALRVRKALPKRQVAPEEGGGPNRISVFRNPNFVPPISSTTSTFTPSPTPEPIPSPFPDPFPVPIPQPFPQPFPVPKPAPKPALKFDNGNKAPPIHPNPPKDSGNHGGGEIGHGGGGWGGHGGGGFSHGGGGGGGGGHGGGGGGHGGGGGGHGGGGGGGGHGGGGGGHGGGGGGGGHGGGGGGHGGGH